MSFNSPESSHERASKAPNNALDNLTAQQRGAVKTILSKIDQNPELGESMKIGFGQQFHEVTHDPEKLWNLLGAIQATEQTKLDAINIAFSKGEIAWDQARTTARDTVTHYGHLALTALKDSLKTQAA